MPKKKNPTEPTKKAAKSKKKVEAPPQPEYDDEEDEYEDEEGEEEEDLENNSFINNEDEEEGGEEERSNKAIYMNDDIFKQEKKKQEKIKKEKNEDDEDEDYKVEEDYKEKEKEDLQIKEEKSEDNDLSDKLNESDLEIGKQVVRTKKRRLLKKGEEKKLYQKELDNLKNDYSDEGRDNSENDIRTNSYEDDDNVRPHRKKRKEDNFIDDNDIGERRYPFKKKSQAGIEQIEEYISKEDKEIVNADYPERFLERYSIDELKNLSQEIKEEVEWISEQKKL